MKISDFSIKRPVFTMVTMILVLVLGAVSFFKIPVTLIPELNPPIGVVVTNYAGASPKEVSEKVTKPIESNLATLPGIKSIQSVSEEGSNFLLMQFDWSTSIEDVEMDILQRIDLTPIPEGAEKPRFLKFDPSQFPIIQLSLRSTDASVPISSLATELEQELRRIDGVASVNVSGKLTEEIQVLLNQQQLVKYGVGQSDIIAAIQGNNQSLPGAPVETEDGLRLTTRVISTLTTVEDLEGLVVFTNPATGKNVRLSDVASVKKAPSEQTLMTRANEQDAVLMSVLQESGSNTASVSKAFQASLKTLLQSKEYENVQADILFDQGDYIQLAIQNIGSSLLFGALFAMVVLFLFLRGIRSPIIIGVAIPYSVIVTFVLMFFADFAINIMTLGALALGIGMLVDNAIVVIENIERHLAMGKSKRQAASDGTKEVGGAIIASTLTTVAVFVPVVFISGLIGQLFKEFALTISFSLIASLVVALTVIPMVASRILTTPKGNLDARRRRSKAYGNFERSIQWSLRNRWVVIGLTTIFMSASIYGVTKVGTEFLPATDEGFVSISVELPNGSSTDKTDDTVKEIEKTLEQENNVDVFVSMIGGTQQGASQGTSEANKAELYVKLVPLSEREESVFTFVERVEKKVQKNVLNDAMVSFNLQTTAGSTPNTLSFTATDSNEKELKEAVQKIQSTLSSLPHVRKVTNDLNDTVKEIQIEVNREEARKVGLLPAQIGQMVQSITKGVMATQIVSEQEDVFGVRVAYDPDVIKSVASLKSLQLKTPSGSFVPLESIAAITTENGPVSIKRYDQAHSASFTVEYASAVSLGEISDEVDREIEKLSLPENVELNFSGDRELFEGAIDDMILALLLAVILVYLVMAAQFESFVYPFVIMFSVPLMIIGVAASLVITKTPISITAVIGLLVLVGIVVNNGIVLVDYILQQKRAGKSTAESLIISAKDRVRPILMTALTTILGLVPLALALGEGTEINQPMGIAVIGGLISSTFLTLYIVPIIFSFVDSETRKKVFKDKGV